MRDVRPALLPPEWRRSQCVRSNYCPSVSLLLFGWCHSFSPLRNGEGYSRASFVSSYLIIFYLIVNNMMDSWVIEKLLFEYSKVLQLAMLRCAVRAMRLMTFLRNIFDEWPKIKIFCVLRDFLLEPVRLSTIFYVIRAPFSAMEHESGEGTEKLAKRRKNEPDG